MEFHHHGYVSGDPRVQPAADVGLNRSTSLPEHIDVLIVGSGPAGACAAAQLAQFPNIETRIIERRPGRLEIGQADGIQARSVETFQAFGFAGRIISEAYRITEMAFWKPDPQHPEHIHRAAVKADDETGVSEFPHLIVNQARVLDYFNEVAAQGPARITPDYGVEFVSLTVTHDGDYPVAVTVRDSSGNSVGEERTVHARYVIGADGARSRVRESIGARHVGAVSNHAWGVMDILPETDFPDIRTKCAIQSHTGGNILLIPREGGFLVRFYVDLGAVPEDDAHAVRRTPLDEIVAKANQILTPYRLEARDVAWHSVYEVGHRVTDRFDDVPAELAGDQEPRVFITGDACHTHSAKAGQGMNVSIQDGWNIAWKIAHVLDGRADSSLLSTYTVERRAIAQDLIDFDREWSTLMATPPEELKDPSYLEEFYVRTAEFPAGFMTTYQPSQITGTTAHQNLAEGFQVGKRFASSPVIRVCDGNPVHLGHQATADGRWRIYVFADQDGLSAGSPTATLAEWLNDSPDSPLRLTPEDADPDAWFDVKVIYQQSHHDVETTQVPRVFRPRVGPFHLTDSSKAFAVDAAHDIFDERRINRAGAIVVVRPDHYVSQVLPLTAADQIFREGHFRRLGA